MSAATALYDAFFLALSTRLAPQGFERSAGALFQDRPDGEVVKLGTQKSRHSDRAHSIVQVHVGLTCEGIARFLGERKLTRRPRKPELGAALGEFFDHRGDAWWLVEAAPDPAFHHGHGQLAGRGSPDEVAESIASIVVDRVLPALAPLTSELALRDYALAGGRIGRSVFHPMHVALLTAKHGPPEAFERYAAATLARQDSPEWYYRPLIDRLRRGDVYAKGFAPGD